jgi:hypothetical protein
MSDVLAGGPGGEALAVDNATERAVRADTRACAPARDRRRRHRLARSRFRTEALMQT